MKKDALGTAVLVAIIAICLYIWYRTSDFALALVLVTAAFFVIWLVDRVAFARRADPAASDQESTISGVWRKAKAICSSGWRGRNETASAISGSGKSSSCRRRNGF